MTRDLLAFITEGDFISFAGGAPDPALLDTAGLTQCLHEVLAERGPGLFQYSITEGEPELREAMAQEISRRHLPAGPASILITTGSQEVLFLLARVILNPGDTVLVEAPTYPAAIQAFTMSGARVIPVASDDHGVYPEALREAIATYDPTLVYLIPAFQNPTGRSMSAERCGEVQAVLNNSRALLVEDDAYSPLAFDGRVRTPLSAGINSENGAVYLASLSKFMSPAMRIGAVLLPDWLVQPMTVAKQVSTLHNSVLDQLAAAKWLASSGFPETLERMRRTYSVRCQEMRAALTELLPDGTHITNPEGGMFL